VVDDHVSHSSETGPWLGVDAYLSKPFESADLVSVVRELAGAGRRYP
jgi:CheY-like chemotaxis protein